jgi:superfamily II DNA helicase RecQ/very-short-patch-repair endonuclease
MVQSLNGGFVLSAVVQALQQTQERTWRTALRNLCAFVLTSNFPERSSTNPLHAVLANILSRGLPTFASVAIEDHLTQTFACATRRDSAQTGEILYDFHPAKCSWLDLMTRSLAIVDPRLSRTHRLIPPYPDAAGFPENDAEWAFLSTVLPELAGDFVCQLVEPQRRLTSLLPGDTLSSAQMRAFESEFTDQRVDFVFDFPKTPDNHPYRLVIEIDGAPHTEQEQCRLDQRRDEVLRRYCKAEVVRIAVGDLRDLPAEARARIMDILDHPYAQRIKANYGAPLYGQPYGLAAMQLVLAPLAMARLQRTLLAALETGVLSLETEEWRLAVIERDVPCAYLAVWDWLQLVRHLRSLAGDGNAPLPRIRLRIYRTPAFVGDVSGEAQAPCDPHLVLDPVDVYEEEKTPAPYDAHLLLDIAMLRRRGFSEPSPAFRQTVHARYQAIIRSAHAPQAPRTVRCAQPIRYQIPDGDPPASLVYFLQNLFRKQAFREGQVSILQRTLTGQPVIALLPTGAGKSLPYQLSALLQPGIVLVVDPLRSLMRDQAQNLRAVGIDTTTVLNASVPAPERERRSARMRDGRYQFVFVSPERLQIREFRSTLGQMHGVHFSYVVVDEAHCVSEWGHDFRTAYLRLGVNARTFCKAATGTVPMIALTGTASFDVLEDVQRELDLHEETAIIVPSEYRRDELHFEITPIPPPVLPPRASARQVQHAVAAAKQVALTQILATIPQRWDPNRDIVDFLAASDTTPNAGLIFCPHVESTLGVKDVHAYLCTAYPDLRPRAGVYAGSLEQRTGDNQRPHPVNLAKIQQDFKHNALSLLVATKAFGMGIDKPNIRFTVHINMPPSIEAFYQEVGRAGRDRTDAYCYLGLQALSPENLR